MNVIERSPVTDRLYEYVRSASVQQTEGGYYSSMILVFFVRARGLYGYSASSRRDLVLQTQELQPLYLDL